MMQTPIDGHYIYTQGVYTDQVALVKPSTTEAHVSGITLRREEGEVESAVGVINNG